MAQQGFTIKLDDQQVQKTFKTLVSAVHNFEKPLSKIGDDLLEVYGKRVFNEQGAQGAKWKKLSAATLRMRSKRQGYYAQSSIATGKILVWTGALMQGFEKNVERLKVTITNGVDYFKYHQKPGGRKMMYLDKNILHTVQKTLSDYINKATK